MSVNKDIIIRVGLGVVLIVVFAKVVGPVIFEILKRKIPGAYNPENDIDGMIKRQKERLRSQYGLVGRQESVVLKETNESVSHAPSAPVTKEVETLYKETRWGGGDFAKGIKDEITKTYSYTLAETKVNAFILLSEKRKYLGYLSVENQKSLDAIKHYLSLLMLFLIMIEEIRNKEFNLIDRVAKKCHVDPMEFALALQLKVLFALSAKREMKEDRLYENKLTLHQYSEDTMKEATDLILKKEANLWAKGHSIFIEELSLLLTYADVLIPTPKVQHKKDIATAYTILKATPEMEMEEIKKIYKKMAMLKHPDKIGQLKLPKALEKKAILNFNHIQEAYDIISVERKK
ncbi:DnaJ domain-containing protein [Bacteriovorax sp. PP10]|uniref:DnaJ domain-containing protein n=1 Tax=Bacteriovorax antarcticus TaxID=3088717 RepID=A0ABU5VS89_9BACT|nr:DnaJ domain-containing protein [Bacteriovorax sp. PP10]MEA9355914.1 DnaJ domain-containing protein [Bacteriovorax sp. PP10]